MKVQFLIALALIFQVMTSPISRAEDKLSITYAETPKELRFFAGNGWTIFLDGVIDPEAGKRFSKFMAENDVPPSSMVVLNSPGGNLLAGLEIGRAIRRAELTTNVGAKTAPKEFGSVSYEKGICFSACAFALLGGKFRYVSTSARYGVHRFYSSQKTANESDVAQIMSAAITSYLVEMGVSTKLFSLATQAGKNDIYELRREELNELLVTNNGFTKAVWTIEGRQGLLYLKGERETIYGINKYIVACIPQSGVALHIIFDPQGRNDEAMSHKAHSLVIDLKDEPIRPVSTKIQNGWFNGSYMLNRQQVSRLMRAKSTGVMLRASYQSPMFLGFNALEMDGAHEKLGSIVARCI